jgi:[ribosomal protein S5]-alanine N-acetyltransferase
LRLETERLVLRPMEVGDAEELHAVYSDPSTFEYISLGPARAIEETLERIAVKSAHQTRHGFALWSVVERDSRRVIGDCGLQMLEGGPDVELGYKLGSAYRGRGYATEAGRAWLERGFGELGLDRIVAVTAPDNRASRRVMEKLGMTLVAPGRHYGRETVLYEILNSAGRATPAGPRPRS